jgi:hypothetical protein
LAALRTCREASGEGTEEQQEVKNNREAHCSLGREEDKDSLGLSLNTRLTQDHDKYNTALRMSFSWDNTIFISITASDKETACTGI